MIKTDIIIIGAGPCGLFTVFEAGLLKMRCHFIDALPVPGGQCAEIYPKKPIYDIPGYPEILAEDLIKNLLKQIETSPKAATGDPPTGAKTSPADMIGGVGENATNLGTFSGSTIADSETIKGALQDLETSVELKCATGANVNTLVGSTSADSEPANYLFLVVSTADGSIKAINKEFVETEGSP